ncbi:MAG: peptidoglycan DD-metalloendopeptidase family protein [Desulfobacteraceae bacterium]|nr:peptidoglycan DD-metalloendopeptidase family protein [Desulfobacteraceae bacterium]MCF8094148.1 peptidoglycan DD-metalloendopeptidase family protein [Desulfobacteraceae bacterium]
MKDLSPNFRTSGFLHSLSAANRLEQRSGFKGFLFFPGMLFASMEKWWANGGKRSGFHEGLDLCFFAGARGRRFRLDETVKVPAAFDGQVKGIISDFLGSTVIMTHKDPGLDREFFILYAHLRPDEKIHAGKRLRAGQTFAAIAPPGNNQSLPPHLHLSVVDSGCLPSLDILEWQVLNSLEQERFMDPMALINGRREIIGYDPGIDLFEDFVPAGETP